MIYIVWPSQDTPPVKYFIKNITNKSKLNVLLQDSITINVNPSYRLLSPTLVIYDLLLKHTSFLLLFLHKWHVNIFYFNKIFTDMIIVYLATSLVLAPLISVSCMYAKLCFKYHCVILYQRETDRLGGGVVQRLSHGKENVLKVVKFTNL